MTMTNSKRTSNNSHTKKYSILRQNYKSYNKAHSNDYNTKCSSYYKYNKII